MLKPGGKCHDDAGRARRLLDIASARLWLGEGFPIADVLTMLEVRHRFELSPRDCRAYAVEILGAAQEEIRSTNAMQIVDQKESRHAVA